MRKLFLLCFIALSFAACRKIDFHSPSDMNGVKKFLTLPPGVESPVQRVAGIISDYDKKFHFLDRFISQHGYARWDKSLLLSSSSQAVTESGSAGSGKDTVVLIPLIRKDSARVTGFLACRVTPDKIFIRLFRADRYQLYGLRNKVDRASADFFASTIMYLDYLTFGHTRFSLGDRRLFSPTNRSSIEYATLLPSMNNGTGRSEWIGIPVQRCYSIATGSGHLVGVEPGGTPGYPAAGSYCVQYTMWLEVISSSGLEGYLPGPPPSGGSGNPNPAYFWNDDPCPDTHGNGTGSPEEPEFGEEPEIYCQNGVIGWQPLPGYKPERVAQLVQLLNQNKNALADPCAYIKQFLYLTTHQASQSALDRLTQANQAYLSDPSAIGFTENPYYLQDINGAASAVVNFDYFPIRIASLPKINGVELTPQQLFDYFRLNWNDFIDTDVTTFLPYQDAVFSDVSLWNSSNPTSAFLHLDIDGMHDGTVIVSDYYSTPDSAQMTVKTVTSFLDRAHPVSGTRVWGIAPDHVNGGYVFYTTAADRIQGAFETVFNTWFERAGLWESGFDKADRLWSSLQAKMIMFINSNGGSAHYYPDKTYIKRPNWADIDLFLRDRIDYDDLLKLIGC